MTPLARLALISSLAVILLSLMVRLRVSRELPLSSTFPAQPQTLEILSQASVQTVSKTQASSDPASHPLPTPQAQTVKTPDAKYSPSQNLASRLTLLGTSLQPQMLAWIADRTTQQTRRYTPGDLVLDARLVRIARGNVWLERQGHWMQLRIESSDSATDPTSDPASRQPSESSPEPSISLATQSGKPLMRVKPARSQERAFAGIWVESLNDSSSPWLSHLSLQQGDLIFSINGHRLLSPQQSLQVIRKAMRQAELAIALRRGEEIHHLRARNLLSR